MLVEGTVVLLLLTAWRKAGKKGKITKEREEVYTNALEHLTDPDKLRALADSFEEEGLTIHAAMLRKRADLRGLPEEKKKARKAVYDKALLSINPEAIDKVANAFERETATGAAEKLREHARMLRTNEEYVRKLEEKLLKIAENKKKSEDAKAKEADVGKGKKETTSNGKKSDIEVETKSIENPDQLDLNMNGASETVEIIDVQGESVEEAVK
jgi:hypothetical protein